MEQRNPLVSSFIIFANSLQAITLYSHANGTIYLSLRSHIFIVAPIVIGVAEMKKEELLNGQDVERESA